MVLTFLSLFPLFPFLQHWCEPPVSVLTLAIRLRTTGVDNDQHGWKTQGDSLRFSGGCKNVKVAIVGFAG